MQGRRLAHPIEKHFVRVTVFEGELEVTLERLAEGSGAAEGGKQFAPGLDAQGAENVIAVAVALVYRGRSGAPRLGHSAHGERLLAAARPHPRGRAEDTLFQIRIGMPGQFAPTGNSKELFELRITDVVCYENIRKNSWPRRVGSAGTAKVAVLPDPAPQTRLRYSPERVRSCRWRPELENRSTSPA